MRGNFTLNSLFLLLLCPYISKASGEFPVLKDGDSTSISLLNLNVSDPDGESIEYFYTILNNCSIVVTITSVPGDAFFLVLQAHTHLQNVTISYGPTSNYTTSVTGSNIGLWKAVSTSSAKFYLSYKGLFVNTTLMLAVQAYGNQAPTPGGCNMEFPVETAPYLITTYDSHTVKVQFAPAAPPMSVMVWLGLEHDRSCILKPSPVEHVMYRFYLPERDFSPDLYFSALQRMMTVGRIKEWAHKVPDKQNAPAMKRVFAAYLGTGSAYVVVANSLTSSAVYVPSFSYACVAGIGDETCPVLGTIFSKILCASIFFLGLFAAFAAHRFFKIETMLFGFLAGSLLIHIVLVNFTSFPEILILSVSGGIAVGVWFVLIWSCFAVPLISVCLATATLGYFVAAIIFFPIPDYVDAFVSDINYWVPFVSIIILLPALLLTMAEKANILAASILGAYAAIVPVDYYLGSNLRYILINSIRRATVPGFSLAIIDPPYQTYDILLTAVWLGLSICGYISQIYLIRNRSPFPPPSNIWCRLYRRLRGPVVPSERIIPTERTHLISAR